MSEVLEFYVERPMRLLGEEADLLSVSLVCDRPYSWRVEALSQDGDLPVRWVGKHSDQASARANFDHLLGRVVRR